MPDPTELGTFVPGSDGWLALREGRLGGSEIAAVIGVSPFESRYSLWHRKAGNTGPVEDTTVMEWGRRLEPAIISKFVDEHPDAGSIEPSGTTYCDGYRSWMIATPDAEMWSHGRPGADRLAIVEAKTARWDDAWGEPGTDEVPPHVRSQAMWNMHVLGVATCWVPVLVGGSDYAEYLIRYDAEEAARLIAEGATFLASIDDRAEPTLDAHKATYATVRELHPEIDGTLVELDGALAREFVLTRAASAETDAAAALAKSKVAEAMGSAQAARWDGTIIARRQVRAGGTPYVVAGRGLDALAVALRSQVPA